jgi:hypothetical protein
MEEPKNSGLTAVYVFLLLAACIASVAYDWHDTIVKNNFKIILPEGGIENMGVEE